MENLQPDGKLNFSVDSRLLFELGEQLVARQSVALAELVKNSYDADATEVIITLSHTDKKDGVIAIADNGHGMSLEDIKRSWMRIAYSDKALKQISPKFQRPLAGAKGIGRFSARRLGHRLEVQSIVEKPNGEKEGISVDFQWELFDKDVDLVDVTVPYKMFSVPQQATTGVTLLISEIREFWNESEIEELKKELLLLQSPFPIKSENNTKDDPGFNIIFDIDGIKDRLTEEKSLGEEFLQGNFATLKGSIDTFGNARYELEFPRTSKASIKLDDDSEVYSALAGVEFTISYFLYESKWFSGLSFGVRDASKLGRAEGGVRVFLDNFRIPPYGQAGDDWLELDYISDNINLATKIHISDAILDADPKTKRPAWLRIPNNNNLFGWVLLSQSKHFAPSNSNSESLIIRSSREGLLENTTFEQLKRFIQRGIYWLTLKSRSEIYQQERKKATKQSAKQTVKEASENFTSSVENTIDKTAVNLTETAKRDLTTNVQKTFESQLKTVVNKYEFENQELRDQAAMLRLLASAGTSLLVMQHQLRALVDDVSGILSDINILKPDIPPKILKEYNEIAEQISIWNTVVSELVEPVVELVSQKNRKKKEQLFIHEIISAVHRPMRYYIETYNIAFETDVSRSIRTPPMYRAELYSILLNLLTNALKAVYGTTDPRILVRAFREETDETIRIQMLNTGKIAEKEKWETYFEPLEGSHITNPVLGVGTGLGLTVVRDTIELNGGTVSFIEVSKPWATGLELRIKESKRK